jgi:hypothetical protein
MTMPPNLTPLLPDDAALRVRRDALVAELRRERAGAYTPARRRRVPVRLVAVSAGLAVGVTIVVALFPGGGQHNRPGPGGLLERAEAAIASRDQILALSIHAHVATDGQSEDHAREWRAHEWALAGAGGALQTRRFTSEGPLNRPPTEADGD